MINTEEKYKSALSSKSKIPFKDLEALFDPELWHVGVITAEQLLECSLMPIKAKAHHLGNNFTNEIHYKGLTNALIVAHTGHTWDYTHYDKANQIMIDSQYYNWYPIYTNFKEAALRAGIGVRARNSLIYNYRFGFDVHFTAIGIVDDIVDLPTDRRHNRKLWNRCIGCDDCMIACPVGAIRNKADPMWLNSPDCDNMIGSGHPSRPDIPSIKTFWAEHIHPEVPKEVLNNIWTKTDIEEHFGVSEWLIDSNGYTYDGQVIKDKNGDAVNVPFCRECTSQPRCSKWNGKYPYERVKGRIKDIIASDAPSASKKRN